MVTQKNKSKDKKLVPIMAAIDEMESLMEQEIQAIHDGKVEEVIALTEKKSHLILRINSLQDDILEQLQDQEVEDLQVRIRTLYDLIERNQTALERMVSAVRTIATQFEQIQKKRADNGLYGRRGRKMANLSTEKTELDGEI